MRSGHMVLNLYFEQGLLINKYIDLVNIIKPTLPTFMQRCNSKINSNISFNQKVVQKQSLQLNQTTLYKVTQQNTMIIKQKIIL